MPQASGGDRRRLSRQMVPPLPLFSTPNMQICRFSYFTSPRSLTGGEAEESRNIRAEGGGGDMQGLDGRDGDYWNSAPLPLTSPPPFLLPSPPVQVSADLPDLSEDSDAPFQRQRHKIAITTMSHRPLLKTLFLLA